MRATAAKSASPMHRSCNCGGLTAKSAATIEIRSPDGKSQQLSWAAGSALTAWPTALPIKNGASYQLEWPDTGEKSSLDIVATPGAPTDLVGVAQVLIEHGCTKQLDLLVDGASKATPPQ